MHPAKGDGWSWRVFWCVRARACVCVCVCVCVCTVGMCVEETVFIPPIYSPRGKVLTSWSGPSPIDGERSRNVDVPDATSKPMPICMEPMYSVFGNRTLVKSMSISCSSRLERSSRDFRSVSCCHRTCVKILSRGMVMFFGAIPVRGSESFLKRVSINLSSFHIFLHLFMI